MDAQAESVAFLLPFAQCPLPLSCCRCPVSAEGVETMVPEPCGWSSGPGLEGLPACWV